MSLLFRDRVKPEWLTRDAFSCLLDRVYEAGCEQLFTNIALKVYSVFKFRSNQYFMETQHPSSYMGSTKVMNPTLMVQLPLPVGIAKMENQTLNKFSSVWSPMRLVSL